MVEFVSANPTGPLHVGHGRQAALGDAIAHAARMAGLRGHARVLLQRRRRSRSRISRCRCARARSELLGEHATVSRGRLSRRVHPRARAALPRRGRARPVRHRGDPPLRRRRAAQGAGPRPAGVRRAASTTTTSKARSTPTAASTRRSRALVASGKTYEQDGALWLRTTDFGDDKDRVMRKSDGGYTYFVPDVAYHVTKWERGFAQGDQRAGRRSPQHGDARARRPAGARASGIPAGYPDYVLHKMVTVMRGGEEVKISKRAGSYVTLRDLIDEVGPRRRALLPRVAQGRHASSRSTSTSRARSRRRIPSTTCSTRTRASRRCCGRRASTSRRRGRRRCADADLVAARRAPTRTRCCAGSPISRRSSRRRRANSRRTCSRSTSRNWPQEFHSYYNAERFLVDDAALKRARLALVGRDGPGAAQRPRACWASARRDADVTLPRPRPAR